MHKHDCMIINFSTHAYLATLPYYSLVGDNVDIHQHTSHQTLQNRDKDLHWFHMYAIQHRVLGLHLSDLPSNIKIKDLPLSTWLPSVDNCGLLRKEFITLVSRVLTCHLKFLTSFTDVVPDYILHKYSFLMSKKTEIVRGKKIQGVLAIVLIIGSTWSDY